MCQYFTDREYGRRPQAIDTIDAKLWGGLLSLIDRGVEDGSFGYRFPQQCPDGRAPIGCDSSAFGRLLSAEILSVEWPIDSLTQQPDTPIILDILEFCAKAVGLPIEGAYHSYFRHHHLSWNKGGRFGKIRQ